MRTDTKRLWAFLVLFFASWMGLFALAMVGSEAWGWSPALTPLALFAYPVVFFALSPFVMFLMGVEP